jgi:hypothetical protein
MSVYLATEIKWRSCIYVRFVVVWIVTPCSLVDIWREHAASFFRIEVTES